MLDRTNWDFSPVNYWNLPPEQQQLVREKILRRAHKERAEFIGRVVRGLLAMLAKSFTASLARVTANVTRWRGINASWRSDRAMVRRLMALDEPTLRDIGIRRAEIESIVHFGDRDMSRRQRGGRDRHAA